MSGVKALIYYFKKFCGLGRHWGGVGLPSGVGVAPGGEGVHLGENGDICNTLNNLKKRFLISLIERNINMFFYLLMHSLVNSSICPDWGSNPQHWCIGTML